MTDEIEFLTVQHVASVLCVSKMTVYRLVHDGAMHGVRVGRSIRIRRSDFDQYLQDTDVAGVGAR